MPARPAKTGAGSIRPRRTKRRRNRNSGCTRLGYRCLTGRRGNLLVGPVLDHLEAQRVSQAVFERERLASVAEADLRGIAPGQDCPLILIAPFCGEPHLDTVIAEATASLVFTYEPEPDSRAFKTIPGFETTEESDFFEKTPTSFLFLGILDLLSIANHLT